MKKTVIEIEFPNGAIYEVPIDVVIQNRVDYYVGVNKLDHDSDELVKLVEVSSEEAEVYRWVSQIMDWSDVKPHAKYVRHRIEFDYDKMWAEAEYSIKHKDSTQRW